MSRSRKINQEKVQASLDARCPNCGVLITPAKVKRIDFDRVECLEGWTQIPARGTEVIYGRFPLNLQN